jgi:hypothetical protein
MSVTHGTATRTAVADTVVDRVDAGGGAGKLKIFSAADVLLGTINLPATAFSAAAAGVATLLGVPLSGLGVAVGNAAKFLITDFADVTIIGGSMTATGGGGDLTIDNASIVVGQTLTVTSGAYTAPA